MIPVYLAGPDVFLPGAGEIGRVKRELCARHGLDGRFPLDAPLPDDLSSRPRAEQGRLIFEGCVAMMRECAAGIANLTPFRGPSADVGTAFEVGFLYARRIPVFGYTGAEADYDQRVEVDGSMVEGFGLADNLMLDRSAAEGGVPVVRVAAVREPTQPAFEAFEECVEVASALLRRA